VDGGASHVSETVLGTIGRLFKPILGTAGGVVLHPFNWINQPDAATSQVYYFSFK